MDETYFRKSTKPGEREPRGNESLFSKCSRRTRMRIQGEIHLDLYLSLNNPIYSRQVTELAVWRETRSEQKGEQAGEGSRNHDGRGMNDQPEEKKIRVHSCHLQLRPELSWASARRGQDRGWWIDISERSSAQRETSTQLALPEPGAGCRWKPGEHVLRGIPIEPNLERGFLHRAEQRTWELMGPSVILEVSGAFCSFVKIRAISALLSGFDRKTESSVHPGTDSSQLPDTCSIREDTQNARSLKCVHGSHSQASPQRSGELKANVNHVPYRLWHQDIWIGHRILGGQVNAKARGASPW